jgi:hypothetical protein
MLRRYFFENNDELGKKRVLGQPPSQTVPVHTYSKLLLSCFSENKFNN